MNAELAVDPILFAGAALLAVGVVVAGVARRFRAPALLLFLGIGMVIGADGLGWFYFDDPGRAQAIAVVALVVILYEGGLSTSVRDLRTVTAPAGLMATIGVVITWAVVAGVLLVVTDVDPTTCALIGAVIASTDAAAVFSVLRTTRVRRRLVSLLEAESGANDPVAVLLTIGVLVAWEHDPTVVDWITFGVRQLLGGLVVGLAVGWLAAAVVRSERLGTATLYPVFALSVAGLAYGIGTALGASGFLAVYVAGIMVRTGGQRHRAQIVRFHRGLADVAQITLFLMLGLLVFPAELPAVATTGLITAAALVLLARPLAVGLILPWFGFRLPELVFAAWAGLRGAVPIVLATFPLTAGYDDGSLVFDVVFFVVLVSAVVQGLTLGPVARALGLSTGSLVGSDVVAEVVPVDLAGLDVVELEIGPEHFVAGQLLRDRPMPAGARVAATVRGERVEVPHGGTRVEADDLLVVIVPADAPEVIEQLERWVVGDPPS
jgi:potassium/hydrogen antiporter